MRILVTGSAGRIGRALVPALLQAGHEVRSFDCAPPSAGDCEHIAGDLLDSASIHAAAHGMDAVAHLAAIAHDSRGTPDEIFEANVRGTWNLLAACRQAGTGRIVFFSSVNALGNFQGYRTARQFPIDDRYPHHPVSPYQLSKLLGEEMCRSYAERAGAAVVCLRPVFVASPDIYARWRKDDPAIRESRMRADYWSYVDVRDVCDAALLGLTNSLTGFHTCLLCARDTSVNSPTAELLDRHFPDVPWRSVGRDRYLEGAPNRSLVDCCYAEEALGWTARRSWRHAGEDK